MRTAVLSLACLAIAGCGDASETTPSEDAASRPVAADDAGKLWVSSQYADRHTCPSEKCGIVGRLYFREAASPLEKRDGWVRVSRTYDASCEHGRSAYVDKGNDTCTEQNGIKGGQFAEWVKADLLSSTRPADPAATAAASERLVADSDDFTQHRKAFVRAAENLISQGRCTAKDFEEQGGWMKSVNQRDEPVYFTYCGGMTAAHKIYLNAETGEIS